MTVFVTVSSTTSKKKCTINEFNFIHPSVSDKDIEKFGFGAHTFGMNFPNCWRNCWHIDDNWVMANVMYLAGVFSSVSIAKKYGWNKPIPKGFSELTIGKMEKKVWILNEMS